VTALFDASVTVRELLGFPNLPTPCVGGATETSTVGVLFDVPRNRQQKQICNREQSE